MSNRMSIPENSCDPNLTCCRDELQSVPPDPVSMTTNDAPTMGPVCSEDGGFVSGDYYGDAPIRENKFQANHTKLAHAFSLGEFVLGILAGPAGCAPVDNSASAGDGGPDAASQPAVPQGNHPPELQVSDYYTVNEGETLSFTAKVSDPDGDQNTLSAYGLPDGATFDPSSGHFSWRTGYDDAGEYEIALVASDGSLSVSREVILEVRDNNRPPVFDPVGAQEVREGHEVSFTVSAVDPDGLPVTVDVDGFLPAGAIFEPSTGIFSWTPDNLQAGDHTAHFRASDGQRVATLDVPITVQDIPLIETTSDEFVITTGLSGTDNSPQVALQEDGHFMAVWHSGLNLKAHAFDPEAIPLDDEFVVDSATTGDGIQRPFVSVHRSGDYVVSWLKAGTDIYLRRFDENGAPTSETLLVKSATGMCREYGLIAADRDTNYDFVLAHARWGAPCGWDAVIKVHYGVFPDDEEEGVWLGDEITFGDPESLSHSSTPTVAFGSDGGDFYGRTYITYDHADPGTAPCSAVGTTSINQWTTTLDYQTVDPPPSYVGPFCPRLPSTYETRHTPIASVDSASYGVLLKDQRFVWLRQAGLDQSFFYGLGGDVDGFLWSGGLLVAGDNEASLMEARYFDTEGVPLEDPIALSDSAGEQMTVGGNRDKKVAAVWREGSNLVGRLIQLR